MRSARGAQGQPAPARKVVVQLVWKDASGFLLLNASRESAVAARTANLPVHGFYFAAAGQVQTVPVSTYVQGSPTDAVILFGSSSRPRSPPHPEPIDMYDNQCRDLLMGSQR